MNTEQFLSIPENRAVVRALCQRVLAEVAADEVADSADLIDPLMDMAARGEVVAVDTSDEHGGFGGSDLLVLVVVPMVVGVVSKLIADGIELVIKEAGEKLKRDRDKEAKNLLRINVGDVEAIITRTGSKRSRKKINELTRAVNAAILAYLES